MIEAMQAMWHEDIDMPAPIDPKYSWVCARCGKPFTGTRDWGYRYKYHNCCSWRCVRDWQKEEEDLRNWQEEPIRGIWVEEPNNKTRYGRDIWEKVAESFRRGLSMLEIQELTNIRRESIRGTMRKMEVKKGCRKYPK